MFAKSSAFVLGVLALGLLGAGQSQAQDTYVIGASADLSGPAAGTYASVANALAAYVEHLNGKGGVQGRKIKLVLRDNQGDPAKASADAKALLGEERAVLLINMSLSSTYPVMVAESKRANVPLYFAGGVCPKETYPPADPLQFCSTAFAANLDSQGALGFIKATAKEPVRLGLGSMAIPIARAEMDYAERLAGTLGFTVIGKEVMPPPTVDYGPLAAKLREGNPNWVYSWSPWVAQARIAESLRKSGWAGGYVTWAHAEAEDEVARLKDGAFYIIGANALVQDEVPIQAEIKAIVQKAALKFPVTQLTEGFIAGLVLEEIVKNTPPPATPAKIQAAMARLKVDLKGLRGGPLEWTQDNHFRTKQYYRVWRWDPGQQKLVRVQDWVGVDVKR